jgi:hypothetical protein
VGLVQDEYAKMRAENDWTSEQVARFPDRLRGFCGFNALPPPRHAARDRGLHKSGCATAHFQN